MKSSDERIAMATAPASRIERDSMGELAVPADALWGAQTQRAIDNFHVERTADARALRARAVADQGGRRARKRTARAHRGAARRCDQAACDELHADATLMTHFPLDVFQTGSGTSTNMNANEVLATLASRRLGAPCRCQRRRQPRTEQQRRDPVGDPRRRCAGGARRAAAGAGTSRRGDARQGRRAAPAREDRPHASDGRDAGAFRPGARTAGRSR